MRLEEALPAAEDRLLVAVLVHLTGELCWLDEPFRSLCAIRDVPGGEAACTLDPDTITGLRGELREAVANLCRDGEWPRAAGLPDDAVLERLVEVVIQAHPAGDYVTKLKEDLTPVAPREALPGAPRVTIIGAGVSGLGMAMKLQQTGIPFRVLEKHDNTGGVWLENSYPRCGVDSPNHVYSFTHVINPRWTRYYAQRAEILDYIRTTARESGILDRFEFGVEVTALRWSDTEKHWVVHTAAADCAEHVSTSEIVILATGTLNQPKYPTIPGIETFAGAAFHTARWQHDVDLQGRRVGMIGNGSSGFQVGPYLAETAGHLTAFQRSPAWAAANPLAGVQVPDAIRWLLENVPHYAEWHRFALYWSSGDAGYPNLQVDPQWNGQGISERNEQIRARLTGYIREQLGDHTDLVDAMVPDCPPFTKRMVVDDGWIASLTRDDVELVVDEIVGATPRGIRTADGRHHDLDVIVYATGFHGTRYFWPLTVTGRSGRTPAEIAGGVDEVRAYLGVVVPDFPNLFSIFGPNASIGHGGSAIHIAECHANYIAGSILAMIDAGIDTLECRQDVYEAYNERLDHELTSMVWSQPGVRSRYRNTDGRIVTNHPWTLQRFWQITRHPDLSDYVIGTTS